MELGNEFRRDPLGMDNVPVLGTMNFDRIQMRCGDMLSPETGERIGVIVEWWFPALPWFRFRMSLETLHAITFRDKLNEVLEDETAAT
jgi:hypothetical protein